MGKRLRSIRRRPGPRPRRTGDWRWMSFCLARDRCRRFREELEGINAAGAELTRIEAQSPPPAAAWMSPGATSPSAGLAAEARGSTARRWPGGRQPRKRNSPRCSPSPRPASPGFFRLRRGGHEAGIREQVAGWTPRNGRHGRRPGGFAEAAATEARCAAAREAARQALDALDERAAGLGLTLHQAPSAAGDALPGPGFWEQPDAGYAPAAPWNGGAFRDARDALFAAAVRLHRAFIVAAGRRIKPALNAVAGLAVNPSAPRPSRRLGPVLPGRARGLDHIRIGGRMFQGFGAAELGWLLIDEAGQAAPQAAVGAIWRAGAVVIGDPLQIEPVVTTPLRDDAADLRKPPRRSGVLVSAGTIGQTLADRASAARALPCGGRRAGAGGTHHRHAAAGAPPLRAADVRPRQRDRLRQPHGLCDRRPRPRRYGTISAPRPGSISMRRRAKNGCRRRAS